MTELLKVQKQKSHSWIINIFLRNLDYNVNIAINISSNLLKKKTIELVSLKIFVYTYQLGDKIMNLMMKLRAR